MEKIVPNGTEVLIFNYIKEWGPKQDDDKYITGVVQSSTLSDDLSIHGSSYHVLVYKVLGSNGRIYTGTYGYGLIGKYFFRTKEDYIKVLKSRISNNNEIISKLQESNVEYINRINLLTTCNAHSQHIGVSAFPCRKAFVVNPEHAKECINQTDCSQVNQIGETFEENNLGASGPVLKRTKEIEENSLLKGL